MRSLKLILFISICFVFIKPVNAQQAPMYSQYMFNEYIINPAVAGTFNYFQVRGNFRNQWIGIEGGPQTMSIAGYGPFKDRDMGYGGYIYNDATGPESRLSLGGSYAYHVAINDVWRISGGISVGMFQYKLDGTKLYINNEINDPAMTSTVYKKTMFDATAGLYAWTTYYYVGLSAHQLLGNKYSLHETDTIQGISRLKQHVYLTGGALIYLNKEFQISPSALIKYTSPGIIQGELSAKLNYMGMAWFGLSYRSSDAIVVMAGYNYENKISIGLAYDITLSEIRQYSGSTIEVMLVYRFNNIK
ncbi:MAG: type IX secretion system membrane protein PorP/SprF [Bacteroidales bacterium]|nr:type IX secretion system membrane protein PorP/SprF [Bacteroidales bacterium]